MLSLRPTILHLVCHAEYDLRKIQLMQNTTGVSPHPPEASCLGYPSSATPTPTPTPTPIPNPNPNPTLTPTPTPIQVSQYPPEAFFLGFEDGDGALDQLSLQRLQRCLARGLLRYTKLVFASACHSQPAAEVRVRIRVRVRVRVRVR